MTSALCLLLWSTLFHAASPLTGVVHAANGAPVSGARVVVHEPNRDEIATTDGHGVFSFADVALPASVEVTATGFEPARRTVTSSPADVTLGPANLVESVVVSADRAPAWRDASSGATILGKSDLALLPAVTLDESLRAVSGFSLFRRSSAAFANPTTDGVTMRGLSASGASRGLILLDGVPLNDGFGGWVTWTRLPTEAVSRVDVDRGAAGDAFGIRRPRRRHSDHHPDRRTSGRLHRRRCRVDVARQRGSVGRTSARSAVVLRRDERVTNRRIDRDGARGTRAHRHRDRRDLDQRVRPRRRERRRRSAPDDRRLGRERRSRQRHAPDAEPDDGRHVRGNLHGRHGSDDADRTGVRQSE